MKRKEEIFKFHLNSRGESCSPSTYVTFTGEDGQILSSPVRAETLYPEWEWTEIFHVIFIFVNYDFPKNECLQKIILKHYSCIISLLFLQI